MARKVTGRTRKLGQIRRRLSNGPSMVRRMSPEMRVALLTRDRKRPSR